MFLEQVRYKQRIQVECGNTFVCLYLFLYLGVYV